MVKEANVPMIITLSYDRKEALKGADFVTTQMRVGRLPAQLSMRGGAKYSDAACNLIQSIYNNTSDIQYVDVLNNGAIADLPLDSAVEIACHITYRWTKTNCNR